MRKASKKKETSPAAVSIMPAWCTYSEVDSSELPFISRENSWNVPAVADYSLANELGAQYAAHYLQFLKDNSDIVGMPLLGRIVRAMDFSDVSRKGVCVGFLSYLERMAHATAERIDVYQDVEIYSGRPGQVESPAFPVDKAATASLHAS